MKASLAKSMAPVTHDQRASGPEEPSEPIAPQNGAAFAEQPMPTEGEGDILRDLARDLPELILGRRDVGVEKYGRPLQAHNGRDAGRDLEEELLDAFAYARQIQVERRDLEIRLITARGTATEAVNTLQEVAGALDLPYGSWGRAPQAVAETLNELRRLRERVQQQETALVEMQQERQTQVLELATVAERYSALERAFAALLLARGG